MKHKRERHIPQDSRQIDSKGTDAAVYFLEKNGKPYSMGFFGRQQKPDFYHVWSSEIERQRHAHQFIERRRAHAEYMAERRAERSALHTLRAGDILESSWGYEQTNRDFYQVVEVKGEKSVVIRKIASKLDHNTCGRNDYVVADPDNFTGEPMLKRANSENRVKVRDWGVWARPWSGQPVYETALGWGH